MGRGSFITTSVTFLLCYRCAGFLAVPGIHEVNFSFKSLHNLFPSPEACLICLSSHLCSAISSSESLSWPFMITSTYLHTHVPTPTPHPTFLIVSSPIAYILFSSCSFFHLNDPFPKQNFILFNRTGHSMLWGLGRRLEV